MKKTLGAGLILIVALLIWAQQTYPLIGNYVYRGSMAAEAALYGFHKQRADIGELEMVFYRGGNPEKPTLLMLHGYSADKDVWLRFARHFTDDYQVIIPDMAGHGETGFSKEWDYSIRAQSQRLAALLDTLHVSKVHIIGNSMGGFISADFAIRFPERTLSATLVDPAGVQSPQPSDMEVMLAAGKNPFEIHNLDEFRAFYAMTMARPPWMPGMVLDAMAEKYMQRREQLSKIFADFAHTGRLDNQLNALTVPSLLMWGGKDRLIHVSSAEVWQHGVKDMQVAIWDDIGHMPMLEIPGESAARYLSFLQQLPSPEGNTP